MLFYLDMLRGKRKQPETVEDPEEDSDEGYRYDLNPSFSKY